MSQHTSRSSRPRRAASATRSFGLPVWSTTLIMVAVMTLGLLISLRQQSLGWPYLFLFALASVIVTIFVEARGIILTVAQIPLLFGIMTPLSAWFITNSITKSPQGLSTTTILTSVYPLAQHFPILGWVTIGCAIIAGLRLWQFKRVVAARSHSVERERQQAQEADRTNRETASRARRLSRRQPAAEEEPTPDRVTVEQLQQRQDERPAASTSLPQKRTVQRNRPQAPQAAQKPPKAPEPTASRPQRVQSPPTMVIPPVKAAPKAGAHQRPEEEQPHGRHERSAASRRPEPAAPTERPAARPERHAERRADAERRAEEMAAQRRAAMRQQQAQQAQQAARPGHSHQRPAARYSTRQDDQAQLRRSQQPQRPSRDRRPVERTERTERREQQRQNPRTVRRPSPAQERFERAERQERQQQQPQPGQPAQPRRVQRRPARRMQQRQDPNRESRRNSRHDDLY